MPTAAELKAQLAELNVKRSRLELETSTAMARLQSTGMGMDEPLIDAEGFPKPNIDHAAIRSDRQKVRMLSNDHKELTGQMEALLHQLHSISREAGAAAPSAAAGPSDAVGAAVDARPVADPLAVPARSTRPFAEIDDVAEGSPGAAAGLRVGDLVVRFGHVTGQTPNWLTAVAALLGEAEGRAIEAVVLRDGGQVTLTLVPRRWDGRGLLGAHMAALR